MLESGAPLYVLQEVADPLQDGRLLANPQLCPKVGGDKSWANSTTCQQKE